mmetsp:Transcript_7828/g.13124  ORF Transcript_7828/g.13124 Transcript_7828/m.13124 type:complete len:266 (+) Transcript_7828:444-1241(+)
MQGYLDNLKMGVENFKSSKSVDVSNKDKVDSDEEGQGGGGGDGDDKPGWKEWLYLAIIALTGISYNSQKYSLPYAFGYHSDDPLQMNNPFFQISVEYPELATYYPLLSGFAVLLPQAFVGIYTGVLTDKVNRVRLLAAATILWSSSTLLAGEIDNFWVFSGMRVLFGVAVSCANAPGLSLIRDYFSKDYRTFANSINSFSMYGGYFFSSLSIVFINLFGWRNDYDLTGFLGIILGIVTLLVLQEPERGRFDSPKQKLTKLEENAG